MNDLDFTILQTRYEELHRLAEDPDGWLESVYGSDLWVDGLNVFLTVEPEDFDAGVLRFQHDYLDSPDSLISCIDALHRYALDAAVEGEFELYRALAVALTFLTTRPEVNGQQFNIPVQITNHSLALLLSPTYRAVWAHSYNAGLELVIDLETKRPTIFRPEHGRIYQMGTWHQAGTVIRYPFNHYFHEMSHILLFSDLYARVLGTPEEDCSSFAHMEAVITSLEERVLQELLSVRDDLNLIDDAFGMLAGYQEAADYRLAVYRGEEAGVQPEALSLYLRRFFQLGTGGKEIPDNRVKDSILRHHIVSDEQIARITPHYARLIDNLQGHSEWGTLACARNRIPAYREVAELLSPDPFALQKLEESLHPESWPTPQRLFSCTKLPEPDAMLRANAKQRWRLRELLFRIAEVRGFLQQEAGEQERFVRDELFDIAQEAVRVLELPAADLTAAHEKLSKDLSICLANVRSHRLQEQAAQMIEHPFSYLLEPR